MADSNPDVPVIEAYCVRCKMTVDMIMPEAVWTSRGTPGTRGECPECGGTVFRMGATALHEGLERPAAIHISPRKRAKPKIEPNTIYINYAEADEATAQQLAADLNKIGLHTWLHDANPEAVNWAGGVHPALKDCTRMVLVLSSAVIGEADNQAAWEFFKAKRKPVVIAQVNDIEPPDAVRRSARFDFSDTADYKTAFRQMVQELAR